MQTTWTPEELYPSFELYCLPLQETSRLIRYAAHILGGRVWSKQDLEFTLRELALDATPEELDALEKFARINGMRIRRGPEKEGQARGYLLAGEAKGGV